MMFKKSTIAAVFIGLSSLTSTAVNAGDTYIGGNVSFMKYSEDGLDSDASLNAIYGRFGSQFNDYFSGEIRAGVGLGDDTVNVVGTDAKIKVDNFFGAYIRGGIPVTDSFYPYAILGYTRANMTASNTNFNVSGSDSDVSYGLGVDYHFNETMTFNVEYMNYVDKDGGTLDGVAVGLAVNF